MTSLREEILGVLETYGDEDNRLVEELELIIREGRDRVYSVIFEVITQLRLDAETGGRPVYRPVCFYSSGW